MSSLGLRGLNLPPLKKPPQQNLWVEIATVSPPPSFPRKRLSINGGDMTNDERKTGAVAASL